MSPLEKMKDQARAENRAAKKAWGVKTRELPAFDDGPGFSGKTVPRVMSALRQGLGVEDMQVLGICPADEARQIVKWMIANGSLQAFYRNQKKRRTK